MVIVSILKPAAGYIRLVRNVTDYIKQIYGLPKDLIGAYDNRLLTVLHVVLDLQYTMNPQPVARSPLKTQKQDAGSILFRLSDCKTQGQHTVSTFPSTAGCGRPYDVICYGSILPQFVRSYDTARFRKILSL